MRAERGEARHLAGARRRGPPPPPTHTHYPREAMGGEVRLKLVVGDGRGASDGREGGGTARLVPCEGRAERVFELCGNKWGEAHESIAVSGELRLEPCADARAEWHGVPNIGSDVPLALAAAHVAGGGNAWIAALITNSQAGRQAHQAALRGGWEGPAVMRVSWPRDVEWDVGDGGRALHESECCAVAVPGSIAEGGGDQAQDDGASGGGEGVWWVFEMPACRLARAMYLMRGRMLDVILDLDETLVKAYFMSRLEKLQAGGEADTKVEAAKQNKSWLELFTSDDKILLQTGNGQVEPMKCVHEDVGPRFSSDVDKRPIVRVTEDLKKVTQQEIVCTRIIPDQRNTSMVAYLRPSWASLRETLKSTEEGSRALFECHVCTTAEPNYAREMWRLLDRRLELIEDALDPRRFVCVQDLNALVGGARDLPAPKSILAMGREHGGHATGALSHGLTFVLDDRVDVWQPSDGPNIIQVEPYQPLNLKKKPERIDGELQSVAHELEQARRKFYLWYENTLLPACKAVRASADKPFGEEQLPDSTSVAAYKKKRVIEGAWPTAPLKPEDVLKACWSSDMALSPAQPPPNVAKIKPLTPEHRRVIKSLREVAKKGQVPEVYWGQAFALLERLGRMMDPQEDVACESAQHPTLEASGCPFACRVILGGFAMGIGRGATVEAARENGAIALMRSLVKLVVLSPLRPTESKENGAAHGNGNGNAGTCREPDECRSKQPLAKRARHSHDTQ